MNIVCCDAVSSLLWAVLHLHFTTQPWKSQELFIKGSVSRDTRESLFCLDFYWLENLKNMAEIPWVATLYCCLFEILYFRINRLAQISSQHNCAVRTAHCNYFFKIENSAHRQKIVKPTFLNRIWQSSWVTDPERLQWCEKNLGPQIYYGTWAL